MRFNLKRTIGLGVFMVFAGGALAQTSGNSAGGTQNTGGTGQPGTTNSGNPTNMAPGSGSTYKSEGEYRDARTTCEKGAVADRTKCLGDADTNWNRGRTGPSGTSAMGTAGGMGKDASGTTSSSAAGSANAQTKCASLAGAKKDECLKTTNAGGGAGK